MSICTDYGLYCFQYFPLPVCVRSLTLSGLCVPPLLILLIAPPVPCCASPVTQFCQIVRRPRSSVSSPVYDASPLPPPCLSLLSLCFVMHLFIVNHINPKFPSVPWSTFGSNSDTRQHLLVLSVSSVCGLPEPDRRPFAMAAALLERYDYLVLTSCHWQPPQYQLQWPRTPSVIPLQHLMSSFISCQIFATLI